MWLLLQIPIRTRYFISSPRGIEIFEQVHLAEFAAGCYRMRGTYLV